MGVPEESLLDRIAETFKILGVRRAMIVHGSGLDEISITSITKVVEIKGDEKISWEINPTDFAKSSARLADLTGGSAEHNAGMIKAVLSGTNKDATRDIILLNAAAAIMVAGLADNLNDGFQKAALSVDSGQAFQCLEKLIEISNKKR
jgi:anthranilate phosphoribosyltransferase